MKPCPDCPIARKEVKVFCDEVKCKAKGCNQFADVKVDGVNLCGMHLYSYMKNRKAEKKTGRINNLGRNKSK